MNETVAPLPAAPEVPAALPPEVPAALPPEVPAALPPEVPAALPPGSASAAAADAAPSRVGWALAAVIAVHLALCGYYCPPQVVFGGKPFGGPDYQTHAAQARQFLDAVRGSGRSWSYDPFQLAGSPAGIIFDADSKAHELWTLALTRLGASFATAFNSFTVLFHLLAPVLLYAAARGFRLNRRAAVLAAALGSLLWFFDSLLHFFWLWGMISFAGASLLAVVTYAQFARWIEGRGARTATCDRRWAPLLALLPLTLLVHPLTFVFLVVPMGWLYAAHARRLRAADHGRVLGLGLATLAVSLVWLWPSLRFWGLMTGQRVLGQATPWHLLTDYFDLLDSPLVTGAIETKTFFRFLVLGAALAGLWGLRKVRDPRARSLGVALGWGGAVSYLGSLLGPLRHTEPYRFIAPTMLLAVIAAALFLDEALRRAWLRQLPPVGRSAVALLALLLAPRAAAQIAYFAPALLPDAARVPFPGGPPNGPLAAAHGGWLTSPRQTGPAPEAEQLARWLSGAADGSSRLLVQQWPLAEMLRTATDLPIIGGFPDRRLPHADADCLRLPHDPRRTGAAFADYLTRYNVGWVVLTARMDPVEERGDLLEYVTRFGPHRLYRARHPASYVLEGRGTVTAGFDRIEVAGASSELVLKFHWLDTLRCEPGCTLAREPVDGDAAGFLRVTNAPERFVVENGG